MAVTEIEMPAVDMVADHATTSLHARDHTRAMDMKKILANYDDTRQRGLQLVWRWVSRVFSSLQHQG
jgi:hypothetical protein